jgi:hypothetical protein
MPSVIEDLKTSLTNLLATARTFREVPKEEQQWSTSDDEAMEAGFAALAAYEAKLNDPRRMPAIVAAQEEYAIPSDDNIEIDDDAMLADSGDGIWVQAWVYVRNEDIKS